ncbi:MAG: DUF6134 family protein [Methylovirgula sp.]|uniref:DUF6134 family protein n=1 Tax=Methylovirgula sp. TaxID=1978224 RepID=UPI00307627FC
MPGKHALLLGLLALLPLSFIAHSSLADTTAPAEASAAPTTEERDFDVTRDGDKIGVETVVIEKTGDTTVVKFKTQISVVVMFIQAYHFAHSAVETWTGGKFVSYKAVTDDNGKHFNVSAVAKDDAVLLDVNGAHSKLPGNMVFASLWSRDFVDQTTLLHPDSAAQLQVKVKDLGEEQIEFHGDQIKAEHYEISGDLDRDIWFLGDKIIRIKLFGSDHSTIMSELMPTKSN